ncbi:MAG TPA: hypothetical protein VJ720_05720, partial [Chitinophaga sp.]|nr:hypothetical protein [Chitinophaga sp.]
MPVMIMGIPKVARIILIIILLHASFCLRVNGQPDKRVITLKARQITINHIIKQIRQQTGVEFRYVPDERFQRRLNVNFFNTRLDDVLAVVLNGTGLTWINENGGISIIKASPSPQPPISKPKPAPSPADTLLITGKSLDEAVIIGYGTTTQRFNTGNVISVKGDTANGRSVNNVLLLLQGRVAGMMVTQTSGMPGTELKVQLRGQTSLLNGTEPLFIVDDIPY